MPSADKLKMKVSVSILMEEQETKEVECSPFWTVQNMKVELNSQGFLNGVAAND